MGSSLYCEPALYYYGGISNFGDELSPVIVERIVGKKIKHASLREKEGVLFAVGSILRKTRPGDIVWGSGFRQCPLADPKERYRALDIRAVRGPRTRQLLLQLGAICPEIYGDPALLLPRLFPELQKKSPCFDVLIIPHHTEVHHYLHYHSVALPTLPWQEVVGKILQSRLVISSSLHGIIVAEAFGVPARMIRGNEDLLKYQDYYESTGRPHFRYATSVEEAIRMGGEPPICIDLEPLLEAFPYDYFGIKVPE